MTGKTRRKPKQTVPRARSVSPQGRTVTNKGEQDALSGLTISPSEHTGPTKAVSSQVVARFTEGPIPSPEIMAGYEKIEKGTMNRLITNFKSESAHRRKIEDRESLGKEKRRNRGQILAFIIFLFMVGVTIIVALAMKSEWATIAGILACAGLGGPIALILRSRLLDGSEK